jgi:hypothetical protein
VIYSFYKYLDHNASRFDITSEDATRLELNATRDAQFRISYLEENSSMRKGQFTKEQFETSSSLIKSRNARDSFAIRPAGFIQTLRADEGEYNGVIHTSTDYSRIEVASGYPYELNVTALDFNHKRSRTYTTYTKRDRHGQQRDIRFQEVNATLVFDDDMRCKDTNNSELKNFYNFNHGMKIDYNLKHKNVGDYRIEIQDENWTNIDHYYTIPSKRGCVVGESFISTASNQMSGCNIDSNISFNGGDYYHMKLSFEPYYFDLSDLNVSNLASSNHADYLYMSDLEQSDKMAILIKGEIRAKEKSGETTTNFTKECHAKEVMLSLEYQGESEHGEFNNTTFIQFKTIKNSNIITQRIIKYNDGTVDLTEEENLKNASSGMTIDANITILPSRFEDKNEGISTLEVRYNIQKNLSEAINPVEIEFKKMIATSKDSHSLIAWQSKVLEVEDRNEIFIPKGVEEFNSTKLFYFARVAPDHVVYKDSFETRVSTPLTIEIYCDVNQTWCGEKRVNQGNGLNNAHSANHWYTAIKHNGSRDGTAKVKQSNILNINNTKLNTTTLEPVVTKLSFDEKMSGRQSLLETIFTGKDIAVGTPVKTENIITPTSWLKYHPNPSRNGNPYYLNVFKNTPPGILSGIGKTGNILNIKANSTSSRKMDW